VEDDSPVEWVHTDLASGDAKSLGLACNEFQISTIHSHNDPLFELGYSRLWAEFGAQHELESREIVQRRLAWHPAKAIGDYWLRYEMLVIRRQGDFVAVRDHTAIGKAGGTPGVVVHLSHVLVDAAWRRTGLAGWLRALPIQTARACLASSGMPSDSPVTLVAEMEPSEPNFPNRLIRLNAYEKAGFAKIDPAHVRYFQPDFRPPADIDSSGGSQPLTFSLIVRRVGKEQEQTLPGREVREIVESLYQMYGEGFRASDMAAARRAFQYPGDEAEVRLVPPSR